MRILVLTDRFVPEITAVSARTMDHAQEWLKAGHDVTVVTCAPNFPQGKVFEGYKNRLYQTEWIDGVRVVRIWSYMTANEGTLKRILDYVSFMMSAAFFFWRYPKFDIILATSPPLFVPLGGYLLSRLRRRPWVFEIRDLWPATIAAVGAGGGKGRAFKFLTKLEMFLYRKADRLIPLTDAFKEELIERGIAAQKQDVVTNGVDMEQFSRDNIPIDVRERLGINPNVFLAGYVGTTGLCQGLETIIDAAELLKDEADVHIMILGEGAERAGLEAEAKRRGLERVIFHDFVSREEVCCYVGALDASIIHLRPHPLFKSVIPSKIFENMAMGVPMIHAVEGISAGIVEHAGAGICIPSGDPQAMADAVMTLKRDPGTLKQMREQGMEAAVKHYSRDVKAREVIRSLETTLNQKKK